MIFNATNDRDFESTGGNPSPPSSVKLDEVPYLVQLLENTFIPELVPEEVQVEENGESCPSMRKKLKVGETHKVPLKQKRLDKSIQLPGISVEDFKYDPVILVAIRRLLNLLKELFLRRHELADQIKVNRAMLEIEQLSRYTWEQLNVGHWKSVPRLWRRMYTCLMILKVTFMILKNTQPLLEIIRECDMGLLMGEPICVNVLSKIAEEISDKIIANEDTNCTVTVIKDSLETLDPHGAALYQTKKKKEVPPLKNRSKNEVPIHVTDSPSLSEFSSFMEGGKPAILCNIANHWPAMERWSVKYIQKVAGFRSVPVELGQKYTSEDWTQKIMTINEFVGKHMTNLPSTEEIGYIAQHTLFDQLPKLGEDIKIPDYCTLGDEGLSTLEINGWFGPAGTISPCHYDPKHNILVQVFGSKAIRLFSPKETEKLLPYPASSLLFNTSQLDVEQSDLFERFPEMETVEHSDLILKAGQALYIPPRWWHYVKSLEPSFSVSFWFN